MKHKPDVSRFTTCPGSRIHTHYQPVFDGNRIVLNEVGQTDIQDEIEAFGKYTDIHYMLHRLSVGDKSVISSRPPVYGDFSNLPTNPVDAINIVHTAEQNFLSLPLEKRSEYNNDFRAWLASVLSGNLDGVDSGTVPSVPSVEPPVKENVVNE